MRRGLIVLILMVVAAVPVQAQDGRKDFDLLFGDKLKQVRATSSRADDVQLAAEITKAAGSEGLSDALVVLMCETSHQLASSTKEGMPVAINAMKVLAEEVPGKRADAQAAILLLLPRMIATSSGEAKTQAVEQLVTLSLAMGDDLVATGDHVKAIANYRRAVINATRFKSATLPDAKAKLALGTHRLKMSKKVVALEEKLLANAGDQETIDELVHLFLIEIEDVPRAMKYVTRSKDKSLKSIVTLAGQKPQGLSESQLVQLGNWFYQQGKSTTSRASPTKLSLLRRAEACFSHYLHRHEKRDLDRTRIALIYQDILRHVPTTRAIPDFIYPDDGWIEIKAMGEALSKLDQFLWPTVDGARVSPRFENQRLKIPVAPQGDYQLRVEAVRDSKVGGINVFLPLGGKCVAYQVDGWGGDKVGSALDNINRKNTTTSTYIKGKRLVTAKAHVIEVTVKLDAQEGTIHVDVDGKPMVRWTGDISGLQTWEGWRVKDTSALGIACAKGYMTLKSFKLKMISGKAIVHRGS